MGEISQSSLIATEHSGLKRKGGSDSAVGTTDFSTSHFFKGIAFTIKQSICPATAERKITVACGSNPRPVAKLIFSLGPGRKWAHVKNVAVVEAYRGRGLGPLLFLELFRALSELGVPQVRLEAEENTLRHNHLVRYYEMLGFSVRNDAKILYLSNYNESYRKVPMVRELTVGGDYAHISDDSSFLLIRIQGRGGAFVYANADGTVVSLSDTSQSSTASIDLTESEEKTEDHERRRAHTSSSAGGGHMNEQWILLQEAPGMVSFESTHGKFLCAEPDGKVLANRRWDDSWEHFFVETCDAPSAEELSPEEGEWFALRTHHGQYLCLDADQKTISCSNERGVWHTDVLNSICRYEGVAPVPGPIQDNAPAPHRGTAAQQYMRRQRQRQTVEYVSIMQGRVSEAMSACRRGRFSVWTALDMLKEHRCPLSTGLTATYRELLALTAHDMLAAGEPSWVVAVGLLHGLGRVLYELPITADIHEDERDCMLGEYSWIVGYPFPASICCPSYNADSPDAMNHAYSEGLGRCEAGAGLESNLMTWTGPEYMYHLLIHNKCTLPSIALAMLRYYPLELWHAAGAYGILCSTADTEALASVRRFDLLRRTTLRSVTFRHRRVDADEILRKIKPLVDQYVPEELDW